MSRKRKSKPIILLWVFCFCAHIAQCQIIIALLFGDKLNSGKLEFGLTGGLTVSQISNLGDVKIKTGFNLGLYFDIKLGDRWYLHPEAIPKYPTGVSKIPVYSLNDSALDSLMKDGNVTRKVKNIVVPVLLRYRVTNRLLLEGGPQIGLRTKASDIFTNGPLTYENKIEQELTRFDFGVATGLAFRLGKQPGGMSIDVRHYFGLVDIDKLNFDAQKNGVWQINMSIAVGTNKKKKNKEKKE